MNLIAPLVNEDRSIGMPDVFETPFTDAEIAEIVRVWEPILANIRKDMASIPGYRPERYPALDDSTFISRFIATIRKKDGYSKVPS